MERSPDLAEFDAIAQIAGRLGDGVPAPHGIGDDGAVLPEVLHREVVVLDTMVEGVHFRLDWSTLADVATKLWVSNASDVFAMGATPARWLLGLTAPRLTAEAVDELCSGFERAQRALGATAPLVGGDTTRGPAWVLTATLMGALSCGPALTRSGAVPGQRLWCDGPLGWAACGLDALGSGADVDARFIAAHRCGHLAAPRWFAGRGGATGGIDVSDGLGADLMHMARASSVEFELDLELPGFDALSSAAEPSVARRWQLEGGDDYVRIVSAFECPGPGWTAVGRVVAGAPGLTMIHPDGTRRTVQGRGFRHFG